MTQNYKTFLFLATIIGLTIIISNNKKLNYAKNDYIAISENAREIYTGKTKDVYNPLDQAYIITEEFKKLIKNDNEANYTNYKTWPVLSIIIDPKDLHDPNRGILANPFKRGRLWERASYIRYYKNGTKIYESHAGIRMHGGASRKDSSPLKSFKLYFRKEYGAKEFLNTENVTLKPGTKVKRLVLRLDKRHQFAHDLGLALTNKNGGLAPSVTPIALFINGKFYAYHFMTEHQDAEQLQYYFNRPEKDFLFYKLKGDNELESHLLYENLIDKIRYPLSPISLKEVSKYIDINLFTANMVTVLYTGMTDWAQGILIKDRISPNSKWLWVPWDYDNMFYIDRIRVEQDHVINPWEIDGFHSALELHKGSLMSWVFNRLTKESPEYVNYLFSKIDYLFNNILTDDFLNTKFSYYESLVKDANNDPILMQDLDLMKNFIKNRKPAFCRHMKARFGKQASTCNQ